MGWDNKMSRRNVKTEAAKLSQALGVNFLSHTFKIRHLLAGESRFNFLIH